MGRKPAWRRRQQQRQRAREFGQHSPAYTAFMQSAAWRRLRHEALERADHRCSVCGEGHDDALLQVHHLTYERFGGDELPDDLQVVCRKCHRRADAKRRKTLGPERKATDLDRLYEDIMGRLPVPSHVHLAPAREVPIEEYLARKAAEKARGLDKTA